MNTVSFHCERKIDPDVQAQDKAAVLVVIDDPQIAAGLVDLLNGAGYISEACHDGRTALESARRVTPDLIIADVNLGGESGVQLCERIRREERLLDGPVMFLSAAQIPDIIRRAHEAGGATTCASRSIRRCCWSWSIRRSRCPISSADALCGTTRAAKGVGSRFRRLNDP